MKYYTETIPATLAEKLKEKGMPITYSKHLHQVAPNVRGIVLGNFKEIDCPSYAEVFDWLMEKGIVMEQTRLFGNYHIRPIVFIEDGKQMSIKDFCKSSSWHEAADAAIEKALTLI